MPSLDSLRAAANPHLRYAIVTPERLENILRDGVGDAMNKQFPDHDYAADAAYVHALLTKAADDRVGRRVRKTTGDYKFNGEIIAVILKRSGEERFVVEDDRGLLLIMNAKQVGL